MRNTQNQALGQVLQSIDENFGKAVESLAETQKNNFTEFSTLADTHSKQIDELTVQGAKIESFLEEIVSVIKQNDENSLKLTESLERY